MFFRRFCKSSKQSQQFNAEREQRVIEIKDQIRKQEGVLALGIGDLEKQTVDKIQQLQDELNRLQDSNNNSLRSSKNSLSSSTSSESEADPLSDSARSDSLSLSRDSDSENYDPADSNQNILRTLSLNAQYNRLMETKNIDQSIMFVKKHLKDLHINHVNYPVWKETLRNLLLANGDPENLIHRNKIDLILNLYELGQSSVVVGALGHFLYPKVRDDYTDSLVGKTLEIELNDFKSEDLMIHDKKEIAKIVNKKPELVCKFPKILKLISTEQTKACFAAIQLCQEEVNKYEDLFALPQHRLEDIHELYDEANKLAHEIKNPLAKEIMDRIDDKMLVEANDNLPQTPKTTPGSNKESTEQLGELPEPPKT